MRMQVLLGLLVRRPGFEATMYHSSKLSQKLLPLPISPWELYSTHDASYTHIPISPWEVYSTHDASYIHIPISPWELYSTHDASYIHIPISPWDLSCKLRPLVMTYFIMSAVTAIGLSWRSYDCRVLFSQKIHITRLRWAQLGTDTLTRLLGYLTGSKKQHKIR